MEEKEIQIGDKIYHTSQSGIHWIIEKIEDDLVFCSTLTKDGELKENRFKITSVAKVLPSSGISITSSARRRNNHF